MGMLAAASVISTTHLTPRPSVAHQGGVIPWPSMLRIATSSKFCPPRLYDIYTLSSYRYYY